MTNNKMGAFRNQLFIGLTMFGTLVGIGFASGKEIWYYFARFGNVAFPMIVLTGILFCGASYLFFSFGKRFQISTVQQCNGIIFGKFAIAGEIILVLSNLILLASMFAGANTLFEIIIPNMPYRLASIITGLVTFAVVCSGFKGITKANAIITPLLIMVVLIILVVSIFMGGSPLSTQQLSWGNFSWGLTYALLFVSSNMFFSGFIFARMGKEYSNKEILGGSIVGASFLVLSLIGTTMALFANPDMVNSDMPIITIAYSLNNIFAYCILGIVWLGLLTTAFALLYTVSNWLKTYLGSGAIVVLLTTIIALGMSGLGFASFVEYVYPAMGMLGVAFILFVIIAENKNRKLEKKTQIK